MPGKKHTPQAGDFNQASDEQAVLDLTQDKGVPPILRDRNSKGQWIIRYYFSKENESIPVDKEEVSKTSPFTEAQCKATKHIFSKIEECGNVVFEEVSEAQNADIRFTGAIYKGATQGELLSPKPGHPRDVVIANISLEGLDLSAPLEDVDFADGAGGYGTLMHEIGHALGLSHPSFGKKNPWAGGYARNENGTIMSYVRIPEDAPQQLGKFDRVVIDYLYGPSQKDVSPQHPSGLPSLPKETSTDLPSKKH